MYFSSMAENLKEKIKQTHLLIYICYGEESEIKEWFKTINIAGIPLNEQELRNAIYSGPFVSALKEEFSNSNNARIQMWQTYVSGTANRQDFLQCALNWVSKGNIDEYMSAHRFDENICETTTYFNSVINWISGIFIDTKAEMRTQNWGRLYELYHKIPYNPEKIHERLSALYADDCVGNKKRYLRVSSWRRNGNKATEHKSFRQEKQFKQCMNDKPQKQKKKEYQTALFVHIAIMRNSVHASTKFRKWMPTTLRRGARAVLPI